MASLAGACSPKPQPHAVLRLQGPDAKGVISAFAQLLYGHGCNILDSEQYTDAASNMFYQRIVFDRSTIVTDKTSVTSGIAEVSARFSMEYVLNWGGVLPKIAIFVSQYDHVLWELLLRHRSGELQCEIAVIVSNHAVLKPIADAFAVPFHVFEITKDTKASQEAAELTLLRSLNVDLVILARYVVQVGFLTHVANTYLSLPVSLLSVVISDTCKSSVTTFARRFPTR
jgi:formyltetrahydrofolate deformylase